MQKILLSLLFTITTFCDLSAQYIFTPEVQMECTAIKSQGSTGTCWSFSTISFLESELMRMGKGQQDLSEMFVVRNIYKDKAQNYLLRQGSANYGEGSLSHDVMKVLKYQGLMPEAVYSGKTKEDTIHNHGKLVNETKKLLDSLVKKKKKSANWRVEYETLLDQHLGEVEDHFIYDGKSYTPQTYAASLGIKHEDYVTLTSYTHHPFYDSFILEIPDNYSNGSYWNIPMEELMSIVDTALFHNYTIVWDGDVSEKSFSARSGIAILPTDNNRTDLFDQPGAEIVVTQELRQATFEDFSTTDDHLMHLIGVAKDQEGNKYYITKNSWGKIGEFNGYLMMSEAFVNLKTVGIMVHRDMIPSAIQEKFE